MERPERNYATSKAVVESRVAPGVTFAVARMSFGRRVELMRRVRELARRMEFLEAGGDPGDQMDAALLQAEIDRLYLVWGLQASQGSQWTVSRRRPNCWRRPVPRICFARRWPRCAEKPGSPKKNEKTPSRLPFSVFQPGRLEVRRVPEVRPGDHAAVRMAGVRQTTGRAAAGVGAQDDRARNAAPSPTSPRRAGIGGGILRAAPAGRNRLRELSARQVEAFVILEQALRQRISPSASGEINGEHNTRRAV